MIFSQDHPSFDTLAFDSPLKMELRTNSDGTTFWAVRLFNGLGAAAVKGAPYVLTLDGDEEKNPKIATVASLAVYQHVVVALAATADAVWDWFAIQGTCEVVAVADGVANAIAKDTFLKIVTATSSLAFIANTTTRTTASFAIATEAYAAAPVANIRAFLIGDRALVG